MQRLPRFGLLLIGMIVLSNLIGCATFHMPFAKKFPKATASDPVGQILCLWTPGEGNDPDGVPCKGFMGQILFLSMSSSRPVEIDGEVRIYFFDDQGSADEQAKPLRMFHFDSGSWNIHLTDSSFGPAYQIFVPYVRRGVSNANCSLRVRLKPKQGPVVFSEFSNMPLNGYKKTLRGDEAKPINQEEVDKLAAEAMSQELRRTTTISMDKNPKVSENSAAPKPEPKAGQIQLAAYETEANVVQKSSDTDRIRHLEVMLQQVLDQKMQPPQSLAPVMPSPPVMQQPRSDLDEEDSSASDRIRIGRKRGATREVEPAVERAVERRSPRRLSSHPLDDDMPVKATREVVIEEVDETVGEAFDEPDEATANRPTRFNLSGRR